MWASSIEADVLIRAEFRGRAETLVVTLDLRWVVFFVLVFFPFLFCFLSF